MLLRLCLVSRSKAEKIRSSCQAFFMEVISSLCFGGSSVPEPQLIKLLLNTVFVDGTDEGIATRELTPYLSKKHDTVPVIRSFILQLLLEHRLGINIVKLLCNDVLGL